MFDPEDYDLGLFPDIYEYQSVVWTNKKRSILSLIHVFATFCETIIHPKREVVKLSAMMVQNTGTYPQRVIRSPKTWNHADIQ
jgi:hypothetical protein